MYFWLFILGSAVCTERVSPSEGRAECPTQNVHQGSRSRSGAWTALVLGAGGGREAVQALRARSSAKWDSAAWALVC